MEQDLGHATTYVDVPIWQDLTLTTFAQLTDHPQILSGSSFAFLDPIYGGGEKINYHQFKSRREYCKTYEFFSDIFGITSFPGTAIRLPLREFPSHLSRRVVRVDELHQLITGYIDGEMNVSLLFLDYLKTIEVW